MVDTAIQIQSRIRSSKSTEMIGLGGETLGIDIPVYRRSSFCSLEIDTADDQPVCNCSLAGLEYIATNVSAFQK